MMRYIKTNHEWIDTLERQRDYSEIYFIKNDNVYMYYTYNDDKEKLIGKLEEERNEIH